MSIALDNPVAVRRAAMDLLARREHGRVELTRKLRSRGAADELIEAALDRLAEEGLLSEARYLEAFVSYRARSGYGPLRIREELTQRGLARSDVEQACATVVSTGVNICRKPGNASLPVSYPVMHVSVPSRDAFLAIGVIRLS